MTIAAVTMTLAYWTPQTARGGVIGSPIGWGQYVDSINTPATNVVPATLTNLTAIAGGWGFSLGLTTNHTVIAWGDNSNGETNIPAGATNVVAISARYQWGMALRADGHVVAWGNNTYGQTNVPAIVTNAVAIAAGYFHGLALLANGTVVGWGQNNYGQTNCPASVTNAVAITAGGEHSVALLSNGSVFAWGYDGLGETNVPASATNVVAIAAGADHTLALRADSKVVTWGYTSYGLTNIPASATNVVAIGTGWDTSYVVLTNGHVVAWGYSGYGQTNTQAGVTNAVAVTGGFGYALALVGTNIASVSLANQPPTISCPDATRVTCTDTNGTAAEVTVSVTDTNGNAVQVIWNVNGVAYQTNNVLGGGATSTNVSLAGDFADPGLYSIFVSASDGITSAVSCVTEFNVDTVGTAYGWGNTSFGLTGSLAGLTNAVTVAEGFEHALALTSSGSVTSWGLDQFGQIDVPSSATNAVAIAAGRLFSLALLSNGSVIGWGDNMYSELNLPSSLSNAVAIAAGVIHSLALISNGSVIGWGDNTYGETNVPGSVTNAVAVSAGYNYSLALGANGTIVGWGYSGDGETNVPASATNIVAISAGYYHALALRADGIIVAWGSNTYGEATVPAGATNALAIAAGQFFSLALMPDGTVMTWGNDSTGQRETGNLSDAVAIGAGQWGSEAVEGLQINLVGGNSTNIECHSTWIEPGWTATGLCGVNLTSSVTSNGTVNTSTLGTAQITYTVSEGAFQRSVQRSVTVVDTTAPVPDVGSLPDIVAQCSTNVTAVPTATDVCAGPITGTTSNSTSFNTQGTNVIVWTYQDPSGNSTTQTQRVIIADTTAPVPSVSPLPDIVAQCSTNVTTSPTALDACTGTITGTTTDSRSFNSQGTNFIHWTYSNGHGYSTIQTQRVILAVTTPPVPNVSPLPDIVAQCSTNVTIPPTATDACSGPIITGTTSNSTSFNTQGTNVIVWTYHDTYGNSTIQTQRVIIADTVAPVPTVSPLPDILVQCSTNVTTSPTALDACAGTITGTTTDSRSFNSQGTHFIHWVYSDGHGNSTIQTQRVIVADTVAPVPSVTPLPDIVAQCSTNLTTSPTALDACAGTITGTTSDSTAFNSQGTNFIHWTYSDGHGNSTIQTQRVIIAETLAPVIVCTSNLIVNATNSAGAVVTFSTPFATNACGDATVVCLPASGSVFPPGTNTVSCIASDAHGHQSQCAFSIIVRGALDQTVVASDELTALRAGITNSSRFAQIDLKDLGAALGALTNSANAALWSDQNEPLTNVTRQVFRHDLKALKKLLADERNKQSTVNQTNVESVVNEVVAACRLTAVSAIADAQTDGIAATLITKANELVAKGDSARTPAAALRDYSAAWSAVNARKR